MQSRARYLVPQIAQALLSGTPQSLGPPSRLDVGSRSKAREADGLKNSNGRMAIYYVPDCWFARVAAQPGPQSSSKETLMPFQSRQAAILATGLTSCSTFQGRFCGQPKQMS